MTIGVDYPDRIDSNYFPADGEPMEQAMTNLLHASSLKHSERIKELDGLAEDKLRRIVREELERLFPKQAAEACRYE